MRLGKNEVWWYKSVRAWHARKGRGACHGAHMRSNANSARTLAQFNAKGVAMGCARHARGGVSRHATSGERHT